MLSRLDSRSHKEATDDDKPRQDKDTTNGKDDGEQKTKDARAPVTLRDHFDLRKSFYRILFLCVQNIISVPVKEPGTDCVIVLGTSSTRYMI